MSNIATIRFGQASPATKTTPSPNTDAAQVLQFSMNPTTGEIVELKPTIRASHSQQRPLGSELLHGAKVGTAMGAALGVCEALFKIFGTLGRFGSNIAFGALTIPLFVAILHVTGLRKR